MSPVLMKILQVILAISLLVVIHEFGHFFFAKLFKIKVDKFFLFFDANGFKLLSTKEGWFSRLFPGLKKYETEYGIGWLPLGGYCKINGMIDESLDTDGLKSEPQPYEFRSKPAWQRFWVMFGGVFFNFIFAIIMYSTIAGIWGESYLSNEDNEIYVSDLAYEMGFRNGDKILKMDDYVPENFGMLQADLARKQVHKVSLLRDKDTVELYIDQSMIPEILNTPYLFGVALPAVIDTIPPTSLNYQKGLRKGDEIISVLGQKTEYIQDFKKVLSEHPGEMLAATIVREGDTLATEIQVDTLGRANIYTQAPNIKTQRYNALTAIPAGFKLTFSSISGYLQDLKLVAQPSTGAYKSVGSFIAIGQIFPSQWDWFRFLHIVAMLSIMLGVMNLLPIPALDGGHIVFVLYEMITKRKPSEKFLMTAQIIGMMLLMLLMFYACGNDIVRLFKM